MLNHSYNAIRQWWNQHFLSAKSWGQWTFSDLFPSQWLLVWWMDDHKVGEQLATSVSVKWYLTALIYTSLVILMSSIFSCTYWPFVYQFKSFANFYIGLSFYKFSFKSSLYISDISLLSDICFSSIFSHSVICLYFADGAFWRTNILNFDKAQCICFSCVSYTAGVLCKKLLPRSKSQRLFSSFLLRIL